VTIFVRSTPSNFPKTRFHVIKLTDPLLMVLSLSAALCRGRDVVKYLRITETRKLNICTPSSPKLRGLHQPPTPKVYVVNLPQLSRPLVQTNMKNTQWINGIQAFHFLFLSTWYNISAPSKGNANHQTSM
jgi:hypothetical protein